MVTTIRKNCLIELNITDLNNLGYGVGHIDGMTVFVAGAVDGETVSARVIKVNRTYAVARLESILTPSPHRIESSCKIKGCGGCAYQAVSYPHELELKRERIRTALRKNGLADLEVAPVTGIKDEGSNYVMSGYRNKIQMPFGLSPEGKIVIGYFSSRSHRVVEAADCPLQDPSFRPILETVRSFAEQEQLTVYDETTGEGLLRHIYLRTGTVSGEVLVTLVINGTSVPGEERLVRQLLDTENRIVGVLLNSNTEQTNVICGDHYRLLYGRDYLTDRLCGVDLCISPQSFYQVNHHAAEAIYSKAKELLALTGKETVLDLYCGTGSIGLSMAHSLNKLIGVEIVEDAVKCAKQNAARNGVENAEFICEDAANVNRYLVGLLGGSKGSVDAVILDPPRKGCAQDLIDLLMNSNVPRIVYISCDPETLARDLVSLRQSYRCETLYPYDLFPRTGHVETVALLTRRDAN